MAGSNIVFGCTKASEIPDDHVEDLWNAPKDDDYTTIQKAVLEAQSKPKWRENNSLPVFPPDYRHGVTTSEATDDAKKLIYAHCDEVNQINEPGKQQRRNYVWPTSTDPGSTVFGIKQGKEGANRGASAGVAEALNMKDGPEVTHITNETHDDPTRIFGKSTSSANSSAAECLGHINGSDFGEAVDDLGRSLTPGFRNASTSRYISSLNDNVLLLILTVLSAGL